jgi:ribosomal protein S18 acetylase RimI-like enzyme
MIRAAAEHEIPAVGELIAVSFNHLNANAYLVPPLSDRATVLGRFFTLLSEHALAHGRVDVVPGPDGPAAAAVWFDLTREMPDPPDYENRLAALSGPYLPQFEALDQMFAKYHPRDPHWHLAFLAVRPGRQDKGLGSALMRRTHEELDRAGVPAYLEATNDDNIRLYRRHGYVDMEPFAMLLPDGTPFYRMWRLAQ